MQGQQSNQRAVKMGSLIGIGMGIVIFAVAASLMSVVALVGIVLSGVSSVSYTRVTLGSRATIVAGLSAAGGAIVAWLMMRLMMRLVALTSDRPVVLTFGGTSAILLSSFALGLLPAMGYVHFRKRYGATYRTGLMFGVLLAGLGGVPMLALVYDEIIAIAAVPAIPAAFLLSVPVVFALLLELSHRALKSS